MLSCSRINDADMALRLLNQLLERGVDYDCDVIPVNTRRMFFSLVAGHVDDRYLRKNGFKMLEVVQAHGITPPHILQSRLICAWGSKLPEKLLDYFARMQKNGITLSSMVQRCIAQMDPPVHTDRTPPPTTLCCGAPREPGSTPEPESTLVPHRSRASALPLLPPPPPPEEPARTPGVPAQAMPSGCRSGASRFIQTGPAGSASPRRSWYGDPAPEDWSTQIGWYGGPPDETSTHVGWDGASVDELSYNRQVQMGMQGEPSTTAMVHNVPSRVLRDDVLDKLDEMGFTGCYDFVYVPVDFRTGSNRGYAFVNFINEEDTWRFMHVFHGLHHWQCKYLKVCTVSLSRVRGLAANIEKYRNSAVMRDEVPDKFRPAIFHGGERVPFPGPTRELPEIVRRKAR
ncbi:unnamed protein product [Prorocentrum cordatum]|uniref:RRM domain-containing protein n=1 Tax=Prorocentrum cordatum TaxID=2364126 RepID=A0ABN9Y9X7_9DINO|nr:unnamed protein product [Polarella glacialis]